MSKIRIGIVGYGNLGRGTELAIKQNPDTELTCVFTRRDPSKLKIITESVPVYSLDNIANYKDSVDVLILCGGSASDLPVMEKAAKLLDEMHVPFEMNALSAHRTPEAVEEFAKNAAGRGIKVIIAAAGMAAALPGVIAANTTLPVIGVPVKGSVLDGVDALYSIIQMPPGIPVATVAINGAMNAAILAVQMLALSDTELATKFADYKTGLKKKIVKANEELKEVKFEYKTN